MSVKRTMGVVGLLTVAVACVASVTWAAAPVWGTARPATFGTGVRPGNPDDRIQSISCASDGDCTAVGYFSGGAGFTQSSVDGVWGDAEPLVLPAGLTPAPTSSSLSAVSCASAGNCTAVGRYRNDAGAWNSLTVTSTNGVWGEAEIVTFAAGVANAKADDNLYSISCSSPGYCTAVGYFNDVNWDQRAFSITSTNGVWANGVPATFGAGVQDPTPLEQFYSVSCTSAGNCTAVGQFQDATGNTQAFTQTSTAGVWGEATPAGFAPGDQPVDPYALLYSVSCPAAGECVAAGVFTDADYDWVAFTMTMTSGSWQAPRPATFAAGVQNSTPYAELQSVSCSSVGECVAVGFFEDADGNRRAFSQHLSGGTWGDGVPNAFAAGVESATPTSVMTSVSCPSTGNCAATGRFTTIDGKPSLFVQTMTDGVWSLASAITFATGVVNDAPIAYYTNATGVSCSSAGNCTAVGTFNNAAGYAEGYTVSSSIPADPPVEPPVLPPTGASTMVWPALFLLLAGAVLLVISTRSSRQSLAANRPPIT